MAWICSPCLGLTVRVGVSVPFDTLRYVQFRSLVYVNMYLVAGTCKKASIVKSLRGYGLVGASKHVTSVEGPRGCRLAGSGSLVAQNCCSYLH